MKGLIEEGSEILKEDGEDSVLDAGMIVAAQKVVAFVAFDPVVVFAAEDGVDARAAADEVRAAAAEDEIVAQTIVNLVACATADDRIVAVLTVKLIFVFTAAQKVVAVPKSMPRKRTGSMVAMPFGPLVRLKGSERLFRKKRMISPKPSVTMAR